MSIIDDLKAVWSPPAYDKAPPWAERLNEAAYTPPSGQRIRFGYEDVSKNFDARGTAFNFASTDGTYIQQRGNSGQRFPLRVFFWGDNYDKEAAVFEAALREQGYGLLEHPAYDPTDVKPFGRVTRRDDLKTAANQTIFEVTFWETIRELYPLAEEDTRSDILSAVDAFNEAFGDQFAEQMDLGSQIERQSFLDSYNDFLTKTKQSLDVIAEAQQSTADKFNAVFDSINRGIDVLIDAPLALARQTQIMIQTPARSAALIGARLDAYGNLAADIFGATNPVQSPNGNDSQSTNEFHNREMYASGYVVASIISVLNATFDNAPQAIAAAETLSNLLVLYVEWSEANYQSISQTTTGVITPTEVDQGRPYQQLSKAGGLVTGYLVGLSFTLKQEKSIVLDRERTLIDLTCELFQDVPDAYLDALIEDNGISTAEIIDGLPRGREVVYYV